MPDERSTGCTWLWNPVSDNKVNSTGLQPLQALAQQSSGKEQAKGRECLGDVGQHYSAAWGGFLHTPKHNTGKRPYTFGVTLESPFQHKIGTKCGAGSTGEVRWLSQLHQDKHSNLEKWATWDDLFSVMLLGDITAVNHKTINCCNSGIFLINTSMLKSNSVKLKLLMGWC